MKVVIAGGSGLVGTALTRALLGRGDDVVILSRNPSSVGAGRGVAWGGASDAWKNEVASAGAVINLAGAGIADKRWSEARKREIRASRVDATRAIADVLLANPDPSRVFLSASAIGFYGSGRGGELDESAPAGTGFLPEVSVAWETEALRAEGAARVVVLRIGIVLSTEGGALAKMLLPFKLGAGGRLGSGAQWMSWIHIDDLVAMALWAIGNPSARGAYNATAPSPVSNAEFTRALGAALHRPAVLPAPGFALSLLLGDMAGPLLLEGEKVVPAKAMREGFRFTQPALEPALASLLGSR